MIVKRQIKSERTEERYMYNGSFELKSSTTQIKCSHDVMILVVLDFDVLYELTPATHIQKYFNDSIVDTSILFVIMITITVILLTL